MKHDYRIFSKNVYGIISALIWLLTTFIFAIDIIHYFKLYSHINSYKVTALTHHYDLSPAMTITLILAISFVVGSLVFLGNLVLLSYIKLKKYYTFALPLITIILVLAIILPLTNYTLDIMLDFNFQRPITNFHFFRVRLDSGFPRVILETLSNDIYLHLYRNLPLDYAIFWLQIIFPVIASVFQFLGIKKTEKDEKEK
ncbi:MAG: hypothetical protein KAU62_01355 [Candidatus Heimdallarchaeota archaeon]|nr:hypothetical protein [Candidatus Heimdallarchaeota archaeon]MCG3254700.1 hypothetical protein [Candidatus Heimdallarchaeota archaeon]MCK4609781.1 hypothetical protein [Candidatus Heimdallarchaeota archaeon]